GVDLARGSPLAEGRGMPAGALVVLATHDGAVVYPPNPPAFSAESDWKGLFATPPLEPFTKVVNLSGAPSLVTASPVAGTDLVLLAAANQAELLEPARSRLSTRLIIGLFLAASPLVILVILLQRSIALLRQREEEA